MKSKSSRASAERPRKSKEAKGDHRVGVFVCECGGNISDVVDVKKVVNEARSWKGVAMARATTYLCSKPSIEQMKDWIRRVKLDRVVLACCTPNMHRKKFERSFKEAGLNSALMEIVNAREQGSWVHPDDPEGATQKTIDLVRGAVEKAKRSTPLEPMELEVERSVLVVGGGIAGITAALRLAESGRKVYLVESKSSIGGHMIQYPKVFPTLDCSQCILTPKMGDVADSQNIELLTLAKVKSASGVPGNFNVTVSLKARGVDPEKCVSCGACSQECPVSVPNDFNEYMDERKAVYIPFPQAVPSAYAIDFDNCTKCGNCVEACARKAIDLEEKPRERELTVGAIILATGFQLYDITQLGQYRYGKHPNIITSLQMERMLDITGPTKSSVVRLSDGKEARNVCYVLCAGSRDVSKGLPYCSRICCLYAIKQAMLLHKAGIDVWIHYIDMRTPGRRYEEFYKTARDEGINFVKGKVAEVVPASDQITVVAEDVTVNRLIENTFDLVVLCPPICPSRDSTKLAENMKVPLDENRFVLESHPKLDPLATKREGIFACGMAMGPKDIQSTVAEAEGAAMKAVNFLGEKREIEPANAFLGAPQNCNGCGECVQICPVEAIQVSQGKARINEIVCNGCGACIPACPTHALDLQGLTEEQLTAQIRAVLEGSRAETKIVAFMGKGTVYTAADIAGVNRLPYPSSVRTIPVPSTSRLSLEHILQCFAHGADGVMLLEPPEQEGSFGKAHTMAGERKEEYVSKLEDYGVDSIRLWFSNVYVPDWRKLVGAFNSFHSMIEGMGPINSETRQELVNKLEKRNRG